MVVTSLCATTDVKRHIETTGQWTSTVVQDRINDESDWIYQDCGYPLYGFESPVGRNAANAFYMKYFCSESKIFNVDRVWIGTTTKRELVGGIDYNVSTTKGIITLIGTTVAGIDLDSSDYMTCWYVPRVFKEYCALRVVRGLLEESDIVSGESSSVNLNTVNNQIDRVENRIREKIGMSDSINEESYDDIYNPAIRMFTQDFQRNITLDEHVTSSGTVPFQDKVTYSGSACTGASEDLNRTLTHSKNLTSGNLVVVNGLTLTEIIDYTKSGPIIKFLIPIYNTDKITVYT